jgi:hypothetical protein
MATCGICCNRGSPRLLLSDDKGRTTSHSQIVGSRPMFSVWLLARFGLVRRDELAEGHRLHQARLADEGLVQQIAHDLE